MATTATEPLGEPVSVGRVIERGIGAAAGNAKVVFGIAFAVGALPSLVLAIAIGRYGLEEFAQVTSASEFYGLGGIAAGSTLVSFILSLLVHGAVSHAAIAQLDGRGKTTARDALAASLRVLLPMVGLTIVIYVCAIIGLMVFIVPGVMIYVLWSVATPALVAERAGAVDALGRSRRLTRGARWKIFGLLLIMVVVYFMILGSLGVGTIAATGGAVAAASGGTFGLPIVVQFLNAVVGAAVTAVWSTIQAALYVELRDWKDGPTADHLADVFA